MRTVDKIIDDLIDYPANTLDDVENTKIELTNWLFEIIEEAKKTSKSNEVESESYGTIDFEIGNKRLSLNDDGEQYVCVSSEGTFTGEEVSMIVTDIVLARERRNRMKMNVNKDKKCQK